MGMKRIGVRVLLSFILLAVLVTGFAVPASAAPPPKCSVNITVLYAQEGANNGKIEFTYSWGKMWVYKMNWELYREGFTTPIYVSPPSWVGAPDERFHSGSRTSFKYDPIFIEEEEYYVILHLYSKNQRPLKHGNAASASVICDPNPN